MAVGTPLIDVFATPSNARCPVFWDPSTNAFEKNWKAQGLLWINPPFSEMGATVDKIADDGAE